MRFGMHSVVFLAVVLAGCSSATTSGENLLESRLKEPPRRTVSGTKTEKLHDYLKNSDRDANAGFEGFSQPGSDALTGKPVQVDTSRVDADGDPVTLNLLNAPIPQAAKAVLGDTLGLPYTVDGRIQGTVTIQTPSGVSRSQLLSLFEAALRDNGAVILAGNGGYRIVPQSEAARTTASISLGKGNLESPGVGPQLVPLKYVSAENMRQVLDPILPQGVVVATDSARNALILSGTPREIASIQETISVFDVDWMRGMSFALVPVKSSSPAAIVEDLDQVFATKSGPLKGIVRFVPNKRLKSVLVISSRSKYLGEASRWIRKLDVLADKSEASLRVYHVQNRTASELAKVLDSVLGTKNTSTVQTEQAVAPKYATETAGTPRVDADGVVQPAEPGFTPPEGGDSGSDAAAADQPLLPDLRIVADDSNNALLIYCNATEFEKIKDILEELDTIPNQVLLEAVIAEVSLDDDLKYGVRWFLGQQNDRATFSDSPAGAVASVFPGFSYFLKSNDIGFTLNAISSVTNVKVLSAPSLVVLDNHTASLQVGDQVPIVTQSAQSTNAAGAPVLSSVELKDTGVILNVTPRVNDSGLVTLNIEQEVSSVVKTMTSGIDSPTIRQRKLKTSVVVGDSEALALGGLIQEKETTGKSKIPVLGDVPLLGNAFRQKTNAINKTELIIFIRPRVIRDMDEAREVTAEFRKQLSIQAPQIRKGEPNAADEFVRVLN